MPDIFENDLHQGGEFKYSVPGTTTATTTFEDDEVEYQSCGLFDASDLTARLYNRPVQGMPFAIEAASLRSLLEMFCYIWSKRSPTRESIAPLTDPATASLIEDVSSTSEIIAHSLEPITAREFKLKLLAELDAEPVEDGIRHNAEQLINNAALSLPHAAPRWIEEFFSDMISKGQMTHAAGLLQCVGRSRCAILKTIGSKLVALALAQRSVEVREAAATIVEQWGDKELTPLLQTHAEPVPWLRTYMDKVCRDFQ